MAQTEVQIQEPLCQFWDPWEVGLLAFLCGPLGVALGHYGIRKAIGESGCVGFSLTCFLCCIGAALNRQALFRHFSSPTSFLWDCLGYICCSCCFVTQEYRKAAKGRGERKPAQAASQF